MKTELAAMRALDIVHQLECAQLYLLRDMTRERRIFVQFKYNIKKMLHTKKK